MEVCRRQRVVASRAAALTDATQAKSISSKVATSNFSHSALPTDSSCRYQYAVLQPNRPPHNYRVSELGIALARHQANTCLSGAPAILLAGRVAKRVNRTARHLRDVGSARPMLLSPVTARHSVGLVGVSGRSSTTSSALILIHHMIYCSHCSQRNFVSSILNRRCQSDSPQYLVLDSTLPFVDIAT